MFKDKALKLFLILGGFFLTNAVLAQMIGVKIFSLEESLGFDSMNWTILGVEGLGFNLTAGVLLWPVVFVMTDIINEYFGHKGVRYLSYMTVAFILYAMLMVTMAINLVPNAWWASESGLLGSEATAVSNMDHAFKRIFGQGVWIIAGSMIAFLVSQLLDVLVFQHIRKWSGEKKLWLRATGSTLVSQFIDSFIVLIIAFYIGSDWELTRVLAIGCVNYTYKFIMAIILTPVIYLAHYLIDNYLGANLAEELKEQASLK